MTQKFNIGDHGKFFSGVDSGSKYFASFIERNSIVLKEVFGDEYVVIAEGRGIVGHSRSKNVLRDTFLEHIESRAVRIGTIDEMIGKYFGENYRPEVCKN